MCAPPSLGPPLGSGQADRRSRHERVVPLLGVRVSSMHAAFEAWGSPGGRGRAPSGDTETWVGRLETAGKGVRMAAFRSGRPPSGCRQGLLRGGKTGGSGGTGRGEAANPPSPGQGRGDGSATRPTVGESEPDPARPAAKPDGGAARYPNTRRVSASGPPAVGTDGEAAPPRRLTPLPAGAERTAGCGTRGTFAANSEAKRSAGRPATRHGYGRDPRVWPPVVVTCSFPNRRRCRRRARRRLFWGGRSHKIDDDDEDDDEHEEEESRPVP